MLIRRFPFSPELVGVRVVLHAYATQCGGEDLLFYVHVFAQGIQRGVIVSEFHVDEAHEHEGITWQVFHLISLLQGRRLVICRVSLGFFGPPGSASLWNEPADHLIQEAWPVHVGSWRRAVKALREQQVPHPYADGDCCHRDSLPWSFGLVR